MSIDISIYRYISIYTYTDMFVYVREDKYLYKRKQERKRENRKSMIYVNKFLVLDTHLILGGCRKVTFFKANLEIGISDTLQVFFCLSLRIILNST